MTPFQKIYDMFLLKISDFDLFRNLNETELETLMSKYLKIACSNFDYCRKDLSSIDETAQMFYDKLEVNEIDILSDLMVLEWIKPYVYNRLNLSSFLSDKDFKVFSQANHTKTLIELQNSVQLQVERKQMKYSWQKSDFSFN